MNASLRNTLRACLFVFLLVWGGYSTIYYLGVNVHNTVLLSDEQRALMLQSCDAEATMCQGIHTLIPAITHTVGRAGFLGWYVALSLLALLVVLFVRFLNYNEWKISFSLTPLKFLGLSVVALWLLFSTLTMAGKSGEQPLRRLAEPSAQLYPGAGEQALASLKSNFDDLLNRGCLSQVGNAVGGGGIYDVKITCIQMSFMTRVMSQVVFVLFILFNMLALGRLLLVSLRRWELSLPLEAVLSVGLGACAMIAILWSLAALSVYTNLAGWLLVVAIPLACYKHSFYWLDRFIHASWTFEDDRYGLKTVLAWALLSYLLFNFIGVVRPFPIGWDDLGRYLNQPRLLVSYGQHIPTMASFYWEYITSLGFLLFGYDSVFGATASMMMNWMAGLLAVAVTFVFARTFIGRGAGVLSALLYYTMPMVGHFSFADMKVDNAVYFSGALCVLVVFLYLFPVARDEEDDSEDSEEAGDMSLAWDWRWMVLAGVFAGFAFAMKPTAIMVIMALGTLLFGVSIHWTAFVGTMSLAWAYYAYSDRLSISDIGQRIANDPAAYSRPIVIGVLALIGIAFLVYGFAQRQGAVRRTLTAAGIFIGTFFVSVAPWLLYNNISFGNVVPKLVFTSANNLSPILITNSADQPNDTGAPMKALPENLQIDPAHPYCKGTASEEELDRYWGYRTDWSHYYGLTWRAVMNLDSAGYYVTLIPALLLFPALLFIPLFWSRRQRWMRWLFAGTLFMIVQWMFFANGIVWYGLGMFFGICIALEFLAKKAPDNYSRSLVGVLLFLSLVAALGHRFWQFDQQKNLLEYPMGKISAMAMRERTIPYYDDIRDFVAQRAEEMPDRPYVYRVGTFIPYFIPRNLEVLPIADNQMTYFNCLSQGDDFALITQRLKALGFNSIIFDTNTATIEKNEQGTLHKKVEKFVNYANDPKSGLQVVIFDPDAGLAFILIP